MSDLNVNQGANAASAPLVNGQSGQNASFSQASQYSYPTLPGFGNMGAAMSPYPSFGASMPFGYPQAYPNVPIAPTGTSSSTTGEGATVDPNTGATAMVTNHQSNSDANPLPSKPGLVNVENSQLTQMTKSAGSNLQPIAIAAGATAGVAVVGTVGYKVAPKVGRGISSGASGTARGLAGAGRWLAKMPGWAKVLGVLAIGGAGTAAVVANK